MSQTKTQLVEGLNINTSAPADALAIDNSGRVGLGTSTANKLLQVGDRTGATNGCIEIANGNGSDPNDYTFLQFAQSGNTDAISLSTYRYVSGGSWYNDLRFNTDGTAKMTLTSGGNVGIGTTSPSAKLTITESGNVSAIDIRSADSNASLLSLGVNTSASVSYIQSNSTGSGTLRSLAFYGASTEWGRFDTSGRLLVGTSTAPTATTVTDSRLVVEGNVGGNPTGGAILTLARGSAITSTGQFAGEILFADTGAGYFGRIAAECDGTPGTGDYPGRLVFSTTADGESSPTERMRIGNNGHIYFGKTTLATATTGIAFQPDIGYGSFTRGSGAALAVNRQTNDGDLMAFLQADAVEGTISVSGTTVSYNGAHLSRWSQLTGIDPYDKTVRPEILRGTVMSNLDEMCDWTCPESGDCQDNEQLNKTEISSVDGDPNVAGVFQAWDDDDDTWVNDLYLAMTGDFVIRIAAGITVQRGDLLCSAGDGTAKPQDDDIIRSKTIAKVTSTHVSETYDDGSYCVPCVLMAC